METGRELFEHELRDLYDVEHKQVQALERMAGKVGEESLKEMLLHHREETRGQIERLEQVFGLLDRSPRREPCAGINGLIEEYSEFIKEEDPSPEILNIFTAAAGIKAEHYEIVSYRSLVKLADQLQMSEAVDLLQQNLNEEEKTAEQLDQLSTKLGSAISA